MNDNINTHTNYPDSNIKLEIPAINITPLKKICMTIGELPASYLETMTYYEMLLWFIQFLQNTVIPTVNNNSDALQEVQTVVLELQQYINNYKDVIDSDVEDLENYMNNYFDNLDVQDEINNKLDDMLEDGVLEQIIEQYLISSAIWSFDTVSDMKEAKNLTDGSYTRTLGFHSLYDGGGALYKIRTIGENDTIDEMMLISLYNQTLCAELIVENDILNVKQIGAKADNTSDNTSVFNKALSYANRYTIYFPYGFYKCSYLQPLTTNTNINIYGDNANIKLLDNVITADYQGLFSFSCSDNINILIEMYGLNIDMNRTNNHALVDTSGDSFALQHCHAIFVYGSANSNIDVIMHDLTFNDLIADGISLGGSSTKIVNKAIINNIISQNRQGTRSDVCITADFDSLNCSNMILDKFEIEVNSLRNNMKRTILLNNLDIKDTLDLDIGKNDGNNYLYANNIKTNSYFYNDIENATYTNCTFKLNYFIRLNGLKILFENCNFMTFNTTNFNPSSRADTSYFFSTRNDQEVSFINCNINYNNEVLTDTESNSTFFIKGLVFPKLRVINCDINISSGFINYRGGKLNIDNCDFYTENTNVKNMIIFNGDAINVNSITYLKNNKTTVDIGLYRPPIANHTLTIYENNPEWMIGKVLAWSRFDKITSFNGGTGNLITVKEFTEFLNDSQPNTGYWIKGQRVKNSNPSTSFMWICTSSGSFVSGTAPTFSEITI